MKTEFKVGDRVFSYSLQEWGEVTLVNFGECLPIRVTFDDKREEFYTFDGRLRTNYKAPDLFFDEVSIEQPERKLQDKDMVMCWDNVAPFQRVYRFYDAENEKVWLSYGQRNEHQWDNIVYVPDEEAPKDLVAMRSKLKG